MTIREVYGLYVQDRNVYCSPETLKTYNTHMEIYLKWLELQAVTFDELPEGLHPVAGYVLHLRQTRPELRNTTILSYCRTIKSFLRWAYDNDYCSDYLKKLKLPKSDAEAELPLCVDEVEKIDRCFDMGTVKGMRNYCIFHLMLDCGLRSQEVRHLKVEHLVPERNLLHIKDSKGKKSRITLCPDYMFEHIRTYMDMTGRSSGIIFTSLIKDTPMSEQTVKQFYAHLKKWSGVQRVHAHLCRHTFATSYLIGGGNLEFLRVFLGHSDYGVTKVYTSTAALCKMLRLDVYRLDSLFFERGY